MTKPVKSPLIEAFLVFWSERYIIGKSCSRKKEDLIGYCPEEVLEDVVVALEMILHGADADEWLEITRDKGPSTDHVREQLKPHVVRWWGEVADQPLLEKQKWAHVKEKADRILTHMARPTLSESALRKLKREADGLEPSAADKAAARAAAAANKDDEVEVIDFGPGWTGI